MIAMRELTKQEQLSFWSTPEVRAFVGQVVYEAQHVLKLRFRGGKPKQQHVLNAVLWWLSRQPDSVRSRALREGMAEFQAMLDGDDAPVSSLPDKGLAVVDENEADRSAIKPGSKRKRPKAPRKP